jgi:glycosyltransferase involved in cell wall biosynthesis
MPQAACRQVLDLPKDKTILLFVSSHLNNKRKGFDLLLKSLELIPAMQNTIVCSVGEAETGGAFDGVKHIALGSIRDEKLMSIVYNAADGFVIPSREDNLPNVVLESLACGTPVTGFAVGGITDMVVPGQNGLLAEHTEAENLAATLTRFLNQIPHFDRKAIAERAQAKYGPGVQADAYYSLYQELLASRQ